MNKSAIVGAWARVRGVPRSKVNVRDRRQASDPEMVLLLQKELARVRTEKPLPPPPTPAVLAYRAALHTWQEQEKNVEAKLYSAMAKRYEVELDRGWCAEILKSSDTLSGLAPAKDKAP